MSRVFSFTQPSTVDTPIKSKDCYLSINVRVENLNVVD